MIDFLMNSKRETTLLTCGSCALEVYEELIKCDCEFAQSRSTIMREIVNSEDGVMEVTKIPVGDYRDVYFILRLKDEAYLNNRTVIIDSCVEECIDKDRIPVSSNIYEIEEHMDFDIDEEEEEDICDECLVVEEIINDENIKTLEQAIRAAYRCGRESALVEIIEEASLMLP